MKDARYQHLVKRREAVYSERTLGRELGLCVGRTAFEIDRKATAEKFQTKAGQSFGVALTFDATIQAVTEAPVGQKTDAFIRGVGQDGSELFPKMWRGVVYGGASVYHRLMGKIDSPGNSGGGGGGRRNDEPILATIPVRSRH